MKHKETIWEEDPEFQIAPMVDLLLCLLVFFVMITSASVLRVDRTVDLPSATHTSKREGRDEAVLNVRWNEEVRQGFVTLEETRHDRLDELVEILTPRKNQNDQYRAVIRADRDCPSRFLHDVMSACAQAGIADITFSVIEERN